VEDVLSHITCLVVIVQPFVDYFRMYVDDEVRDSAQPSTVLVGQAKLDSMSACMTEVMIRHSLQAHDPNHPSA